MAQRRRQHLQRSSAGSGEPAVLGEYVPEQGNRRRAALACSGRAGRGPQFAKPVGHLVVGFLRSARHGEQLPSDPGERRGVATVVGVQQRSVYPRQTFCRNESYRTGRHTIQ
jgi:hypothetical protein